MVLSVFVSHKDVYTFGYVGSNLVSLCIFSNIGAKNCRDYNNLGYYKICTRIKSIGCFTYFFNIL